MSRLRGADRFLAPGERILLTVRRHPVRLAGSLLIWAGTLLLGGLVSFVLTEANPQPWLDHLVLWAGLAVTAFAALRLLQWWSCCYVVTDERVLLLEGVLARRVSAVRLARVTETRFVRSLAGRLLGYGELRLDSAGEQLGMASLPHLPRPEEVYRLVTSLLLGRGADPPVYDPAEETTGPLPPVAS